MQMRQEQDSAKQKAQFYEGALRELLLFRSKTSTALLQLQERFDKEQADANALEAQYEQDYVNVQSQGQLALSNCPVRPRLHINIHSSGHLLPQNPLCLN